MTLKPKSVARSSLPPSIQRLCYVIGPTIAHHINQYIFSPPSPLLFKKTPSDSFGMEGGKKTLPALFFTTVEKAGARPFTRWFRDHPDVPATKWETLSWVRYVAKTVFIRRNAMLLSPKLWVCRLSLAAAVLPFSAPAIAIAPLSPTCCSSHSLK